MLALLPKLIFYFSNVLTNIFQPGHGPNYMRDDGITHKMTRKDLSKLNTIWIYLTK